MTRPSLLALALALAVLSTSPGSAVDLPVHKYVERLGAKTYAERERAAKVLREHGPAGLPELRKALKSKDEEVRARAERLVRALEIQAALEPKRVTLSAGDRSLADLLNDLQAQTGYKFRTAAPGGPGGSAACKNVPFWEALEQVGRATGHAVMTNVYSPDLMLQQVKAANPHVRVAGPFRVEAVGLHEDRDANFREPKEDGAAGQTTHLLTLNLVVHAEPKVTLLSVGRPLIDRATDEADRAYTVVAVPEGRAYYGGYDPENMLIGLRTDVRLRRAADKAARIAVLRGSIPAKVIIEKKRVVVSEKPLEARGVRIRTEAGDLEVTQAGPEGGNAGFTLEVRIPQDPGMSYGRWMSRIKLEDADGKVFSSYSSGTRSNGREYWARKEFQLNGGTPARLVFEEWVVIDHPIPFEFKDVPLP